jgi:hypothetical protein
MNPEHGGQWLGRSAAFLVRLGVVGLDQGDQCLQWRHHLHLRKELLPFGLHLGGGELVIREAELLAAHHPIPRLQLKSHCPTKAAGFPESPW